MVLIKHRVVLSKVLLVHTLCVALTKQFIFKQFAYFYSGMAKFLIIKLNSYLIVLHFL